ncbi:lasso peptide biosynthesis PqqD family chaperone [Streptomyces spirodelae]|uniref:Lasso peptide biosynthesis PqqD family chaperone n=1 Tax=Streptomyces spirodelae TaxID=2812904 RepID=A0ABS3WPZ1_9ACTN|nr:lasso peptide biosynthesis PqqD family chaperone [Streptomyces spirodelae]MBO8185187.1 lasso peptide biosynthesis PqqD family chaperone [Streptomyces spirodelae]
MSLRLRTDVTTCETDDGLVLLDARSGRYWQLNATGAAILRASLNGATPQQIAARLATRQPVTTEQATRDVQALIEQLEQARLVEAEPRSAS